ncbi:MAG: radical SAM protein, partial [Rectinema sp.]|nr:radical SAM protein [Rectinema sp.]
TDRCNMRCIYCMPAEGVPLLAHEEILSFEHIEAVVRAAVGLGVTKVRLTGGEPLVRKGIIELVRMLSSIQGLRTLAMTTNASLLAPLARDLRAAGLQSVNISLDSLDPERFARITRIGTLADTLAGFDAALDAGLAVKINMVVLGDTSPSEIEAVRDFAIRRGAAFQTIAHYSLMEEKRDVQEYDRPPPCSHCNRIRLLANGMLRSCLHSDIDIPIDFDNIEESVRKAILAKPLHGMASSTLAVSQIGG